MSHDEIVTSDFAKFGSRERCMAEALLSTWNKYGLPEDFEDNKVTIAMNMNSGFVFLTNEDYQVALMNGDKLESFYNCPYCGHEGFLEDMWHEPKDKECSRYQEEICVAEEGEAGS